MLAIAQYFKLHHAGGLVYCDDCEYQWRIQDFRLGGCQPLMCTLFGENVCENERNGSCWGGGGRRRRPLDPPMNIFVYFTLLWCKPVMTLVVRGIHNNIFFEAEGREENIVVYSTPTCIITNT